jgi:hypothetical protein
MRLGRLHSRCAYPRSVWPALPSSSSHWALRLPRRRAGPEHVLALRALGWTYGTISEVAKISTFIPHKLASGATRRVLRETEEKILALPLVYHPSTRGVDGTGTYRRLEALQWMGWPMSIIGAALGLKTYTLSTMRGRREPVSYRVALAAKVLYARCSHLEGPSKQTATKAKARGYAPPAAWDEDTIDDPAAKPRGVLGSRSRKRAA